MGVRGEQTTIEDWQCLERSVGQMFDEPAALPTGFVYNGSLVRGIPQAWAPTSTFRRFDSAIVGKTYQGRDPLTGLGLRIEVLKYLDFPVVEWTAWLTNHSNAPTPLVQDLRAITASLKGRGGVLRHCNGDFDARDSYVWETTALGSGACLAVKSRGGRPCDGAFPYFRVLFQDGGLTLAVGWPGQWRALWTGDQDVVGVEAGQEVTNMRLLPGETVRTPAITLMGWEGEEPHGVNLWRRWYRQHVMPRPGGKPLTPLVAVSGTDPGVEFTAATQVNQLEYQRRFRAEGLAYDVWWIDAGWYPCRDQAGQADWTITGTWRADLERFPDGLAPVSQGAASCGAKLLLWFEPERVFPGTELARDHPDWILPKPLAGGDVPTRRHHALSGLLDLSNPACRNWLVDLVSGLVSTYGIGIYRQDFNFPPLEHWRAHDQEDRQGITENFYVQGYLEFWDELLERHPSLLIDSCASGGRRNDLETMRRSVPLHYTDYGYGQHATKLDFHRTMFEWLPYFKETSLSWDITDATQQGLEAKEGDSFSYHCAMAPMLAPAVDIKRTDSDFGTLRQMVACWRSVADVLLDGDYYPLTPPGRSGTEWVIWQFNRPGDVDGRARSEGLVQAIRLAGCDDQRVTARLRGLYGGSVYVFHETETGEVRELSGTSLMEDGLEFDLPRRSGSLWSYRQKDRQEEA